MPAASPRVRSERLRAQIDSLPDAPGVYQLHLRLAVAARLEIGRLGTYDFPAGRYIYTGSALSGLSRRLARHRARHGGRLRRLRHAHRGREQEQEDGHGQASHGALHG